MEWLAFFKTLHVTIPYANLHINPRNPVSEPPVMSQKSTWEKVFEVLWSLYQLKDFKGAQNDMLSSAGLILNRADNKDLSTEPQASVNARAQLTADTGSTGHPKPKI